MKKLAHEKYLWFVDVSINRKKVLDETFSKIKLFISNK